MAMKIGLAIFLVIISLILGGLFSYSLFVIEQKNIEKTPLIGGCGGVYYKYWNECCENWAKDNNILHAQCLGNWTVENNTCSWKCT